MENGASGTQSAEFTTVKELAEICANITGYNGTFTYVPDRPQEVKHAVCSSDKARKILKYKTTTKLKKAVEETYKYIKERGAKPFNYYLELSLYLIHLMHPIF